MTMNSVQALNHIHKTWLPHETQLKVGHALFYQKKKRIFLECGRKWGKGEILLYLIWRWCLSHQNNSCYYMAPWAKQAREILWSNQRIQLFGGAASRRIWKKPPNNSEMRVFFKTGSWIKLDGSDNVEAYRGINPHLMIYDEFKDFRPDFHVAMEPNLTSFQAPLIIAGTPPKTSDNQFTQVAQEIAMDPEGAYFNFESGRNPYLEKSWLDKTRKRLFGRGDEEIWFREYMAQRIVGGKSHIIPTFSAKRNVYPHKQLMLEIAKDMPKMEWLTIGDPGTVTCFGILYMAMNPYTKELYILGEEYVEEQKETSTAKMIPRIKKAQYELVGDVDVGWLHVVDCAAAWFANEVITTFGEYWQPCEKALTSKDVGISLLKDQCWRQLVKISDRCKKLQWEIENYIKDKNGRIPKVNDHLIDCWRYGNTAAGLDLMPVSEPEDEFSARRAFSMEDDLRTGNPSMGTESDSYEY